MSESREGRAVRAMRGAGPIVIRLENKANYYEHASIINAIGEARRLIDAEGLSGTFVVFAPVRIIESVGTRRERRKAERKAQKVATNTRRGRS